MNIEACYYLGYTSKIHGKEGSLVVKLDVDNPAFYKKLESVFIQLNKLDNELVPFFITSTQLSNNDSLILKIEDINDVEQAKAMVGKEVYLPLDMLPPLKGNKFYFHEVISFEVEDKTKGIIGKINQVLDYPQQAILEIVDDLQNEILIPITDHIILDVNREDKKIFIDAPEGLIDLYLADVKI